MAWRKEGNRIWKHVHYQYDFFPCALCHPNVQRVAIYNFVPVSVLVLLQLFFFFQIFLVFFCFNFFFSFFSFPQMSADSQGAEHPEVATRLNSLALLLASDNRVEEAEGLHRQ